MFTKNVGFYFLIVLVTLPDFCMSISSVYKQVYTYASNSLSSQVKNPIIAEINKTYVKNVVSVLV